jgi:hypothetical protein
MLTYNRSIYGDFSLVEDMKSREVLYTVPPLSFLTHEYIIILFSSHCMLQSLRTLISTGTSGFSTCSFIFRNKFEFILLADRFHVHPLQAYNTLLHVARYVLDNAFRSSWEFTL